MAPERVRLEHVGLNHLSWERKVLVDGADRLPELIERHADALAAETELPAALIRRQRAVPSYYLRYYYFEKQVLEELRRGRPRAEEVMEIERGLLEMYADPALEVKPRLLEERGGAFYSEASAMLIESLYADRGDVQVVNVRNEGAIPNLDDDAVVEVPCRIDASGAIPLPLAPLAPEMHGLVQHAKAYERLAVRAAVSGDRDAGPRSARCQPARARRRRGRAAARRAARGAPRAPAAVLRRGRTRIASAPRQVPHTKCGVATPVGPRGLASRDQGDPGQGRHHAGELVARQALAQHQVGEHDGDHRIQ